MEYFGLYLVIRKMKQSLVRISVAQLDINATKIIELLWLFCFSLPFVLFSLSYQGIPLVHWCMPRAKKKQKMVNLLSQPYRNCVASLKI